MYMIVAASDDGWCGERVESIGSNVYAVIHIELQMACSVHEPGNPCAEGSL